MENHVRRCGSSAGLQSGRARIAAVVKRDNRWTIAVDGVPWPEDFDMIWDPVFSPDGENVAAKADSEDENSSW